MQTLTTTTTPARARADDIRGRLDSLAENLEIIPIQVAEAYRDGDCWDLGYETWEAYVTGEYGTSLLKLDRTIRKSWVKQLTAEGMSTREIAPVINADPKTVRNDLRGENSPGRSSSDPDIIDAEIVDDPELQRREPIIRYDAGLWLLNLEEGKSGLERAANGDPDCWTPEAVDQAAQLLDTYVPLINRIHSKIAAARGDEEAASDYADSEGCPVVPWSSTLKQLRSLLGNYGREVPSEEASNLAQILRDEADKLEPTPIMADDEDYPVTCAGVESPDASIRGVKSFLNNLTDMPIKAKDRDKLVRVLRKALAKLEPSSTDQPHLRAVK